jgi:hypothetical protein
MQIYIHMVREHEMEPLHENDEKLYFSGTNNISKNTIQGKKFV